MKKESRDSHFCFHLGQSMTTMLSKCFLSKPLFLTGILPAEHIATKKKNIFSSSKMYSHLSNKHGGWNKGGGWNKHGGGAKNAKSLNVTGLINVNF